MALRNAICHRILGFCPAHLTTICAIGSPKINRIDWRIKWSLGWGRIKRNNDNYHGRTTIKSTFGAFRDWINLMVRRCLGEPWGSVDGHRFVETRGRFCDRQETTSSSTQMAKESLSMGIFWSLVVHHWIRAESSSVLYRSRTSSSWPPPATIYWRDWWLVELISLSITLLSLSATRFIAGWSATDTVSYSHWIWLRFMRQKRLFEEEARHGNCLWFVVRRSPKQNRNVVADFNWVIGTTKTTTSTTNERPRNFF